MEECTVTFCIEDFGTWALHTLPKHPNLHDGHLLAHFFLISLCSCISLFIQGIIFTQALKYVDIIVGFRYRHTLIGNYCSVWM